MVRAAAKNHAHVGVVVDPADYDAGARRAGRRRRAVGRRPAAALARAAFARTAAYDAAIVAWLDEHATPAGRRGRRPRPADAARPRRSSGPRSCATARTRTRPGARYRLVGATSWWDDAVQHGGKELCYLNLFDAEAAWRLVHRFDEPAVRDRQARQPVRRGRRPPTSPTAYTAGPRLRPGVSAFGGIVAVNRAGHRRRWPRRWRRCSPRSSSRPAYDAGALDRAAAPKKNLRVLEPRRAGDRRRSTCAPSTAACWCSSPTRSRSTAPRGGSSPSAAPTDAQWDDLALRVAGVRGGVSSNAIVLAKDRQAVGIGAGQQNRVDSARIAAEPRRRPGRRAVSAPATPSSRSATASTSLAAAGVAAVDPARRQRPRRRGHRGRRRARHRHGLHRRAPLPPLTPAVVDARPDRD